MNKQSQINLGYLLMAMVSIFLLQQWMISSMSETRTLSFSQFEQYLKDGRISDVVIGDQYLTGKLKDSGERLKVVMAARVDPEIARYLDKYGVSYGRVVESHLLENIISWIAPTLIFIGIWLFFVRRMAEKHGIGGGSLISIGKSRAKVYVEKDTGVTFDRVAGVDEAKTELQEVVEFLKNPARWERLGARIPKGVLLVGAPGTGKTLLAKAVAGEAKAPFFSISGSEFVEMFVGVGAARVRDLFEKARNHAPAIIFIDELDALGRSRAASAPMGGHDEREQTLNQLLVEMDGFDPTSGLIILAATNRPEILDPALLRAGRFDRQVVVDKPDKSGREAILKVHMRHVKLAAEVDAEQIAALTTGFSGADLENLVNEAALLATRENADAITLSHFTRAIERIVAGLEKNRIISDEERRVVAGHEMGHALVAMALPDSDPVHKVSIVPRGIGALGYTIQRPSEEHYLLKREELEHRITVLLGGRAAEKLLFGHLSTGASDDLAKATDIARDMVMRYGMSEALGFVVYDERNPGFLGKPAETLSPGGSRFSEATAQAIDAEVKNIIHRQFDQAIGILESNRELLERCASALLAQETLDEAQLQTLAADMKRAD